MPRRPRHTGEEEGATPLPTPAFYSGEFPIDDLLSEGEPPAAQPQSGGGMFPSSDSGGPDLLISEPSVMAPLPVMQEAKKAEPPAPMEAPQADVPERRRQGGMIAAAVIAVGAFGLLGYLVFGRGTGHPVGEPRASRKIDDTPVALVDNPVATGGAARGPAGTGKPAGTTGPASSGRTSHGSTNPARPVSDPKARPLGAPTGPSLDEVAGEGRSLERAPTEPTEARGGKVNPEDMLRVVRQNKKSVELCYDRGLKFDSNLKGKVEVELKVGISGRVTDVKLLDPTIAASQLGMCLSQSIKRWNFPSSGSEYSFSFPLILQANN